MAFPLGCSQNGSHVSISKQVSILPVFKVYCSSCRMLLLRGFSAVVQSVNISFADVTKVIGLSCIHVDTNYDQTALTE